MATKVKLIADGVITPDQITLTTASTGTNTTAPATTAFVQQEITALVDSSPAALNTLNELAAALGDDPNFATTVNTNIATKLPLAGGTLTGSLAITTASTADTVTLTRGTTGHNNMLKFKTGSSDKWIVGQRNDNTDHFRFYSYGTSNDVVSILTNGNVGIGTTSPTGKLTIANPTAYAPNTVTAANSYIQLGSTDYGSGGSSSNDGKFMIGFGYTDGTTNTHSPAYIGYEETSTSGDTKGELTFYTRDVITDTAPTERMRIDSSGNVGIGTNTPDKKLEIFGSGSEDGILVKNDTNTNYRGYYISSVESDNTAYGKFHMDVNSGELNITSGYTDWGGFITLDTNGTQRMYINTNGEVSMGWASGGGPGGGLLQVNGQGMFTGGGAGYVQGSILLRSSDNDETPGYRGQGVFTWNAGHQVSWYMGTPYTNGDLFTINRKSSETSFTQESSYIGHANTNNYFTIRNDGNVGIGNNITNPAYPLHVYNTAGSSGAIMARFERSDSSSSWIQIKGNSTNSFQIGSTPAGIEFYDDESSTYVAKINNNTNKHNLQKWCYALFDPNHNNSNSALEEKGATAAAVYKLYNAVINPGTYSNTGLYYVGIGRENSDVGYVEFKTEVVECRSMEVSFDVGNSADATTRYARLYYSYDGKTYTQVASTSYTAGGGTATYNLNLTSVLHSGDGDYSGSIYWRCSLEDAASSHSTLIGWNSFSFKAFAESMTFDGRYQRGMYGSGTSLISNTGAANEVNYINNQLPYAHQFTLTSTAASAAVGSNTAFASFSSTGMSYLNQELFNIVTGTYSGIRVLAEGTIHYSINQDIITAGATGYAAMTVYRYSSSGGASIVTGYHLITNTNGEWDMITGSGVFDVQPGDIIRIRFNANDITSMDSGSWSYYNFMFLPVTTSGKGNAGGNSNFPWVGSQFS